MKTSQLLTLAVSALGLTSGALAQSNGRGGRGGNNNNNNNGQGGAATTTSAAAAVTTTAAAGGNGGNTGNTGGNTGNTGNNGGNNGGNAGGNNDLLLLQSNVQAASNFIGNPNAQQANSDTDPANFINFCTGKTLTNGTQVTGGSCNGVVMGDIPSNGNMVSAIVLFPGPGQDIAPNQQFNIQVQLTNLVAGSFTDPLTTYYAAPQELQGGNIVGHCHVTVQDLGNDLAPKQAPDPKTFAFFKGINDDGNGAGLLQATVTAGLPAGFYRVCTMNSASNHQPVLMPVAQRGAQDDCQKFTVGQGNAGGAAGGNTGNNGGNGNNAGTGASTTTAAAAATTTAAAGGNAGGNGGNNGGNGGNNGGNNGNNGGAGAATTTAAAAATTTAAAGGNAGGNGGNGGNNGNNGGAGAATTTAAAAATTSAAAGGSTGGGRGGFGGRGGGRGRYGRGRGRFAARDFIA